MPYTVTVSQIEDPELWQRVWDENASAHQEGGVRGEQVLRHPTDPHRRVVLREFDDLEQARRYLNSEPRLAHSREARAVEWVDYLPDE